MCIIRQKISEKARPPERRREVRKRSPREDVCVDEDGWMCGIDGCRNRTLRDVEEEEEGGGWL